MRAALSRMVIGECVALSGLIPGYNSGERPSDDFSPFRDDAVERARLVLDDTKTLEAVQVLGGWIREGS